jgi:hypothetical protein
MNQKGFANIILVVVIVILLGVVGYFALVKKSPPIVQQTPTPTPTQVKTTTTPPPATVTKIKVYAIDTNVPNHNGPVGCGDQAVAIERTIPPTTAPLKAALELLLSLKESNLGESGLYNALALQNWKLQSVSIVNGEAIIKLSGKDLIVGGCEDPRIKAQLEMTALQFSTVKRVSIFVNGVSLDKLMSGKGE